MSQLTNRFLIGFIATTSMPAFIENVARNAVNEYGKEAIEEVIVQATRLHKPLSGLSLSVGVINRDVIQRQNADHPAEILSLVPGVNLNRGSGAEQLTALRSPVLTGSAGAGSFLHLQDGVPLRDAHSVHLHSQVSALFNQNIRD